MSGRGGGATLAGRTGWHDISVALRPGTPEWPGDVPFTCGWTTRIADGAAVNLSVVRGSPHVGTHADAPLHVNDGWPASEALDVGAFVGPCVVVDVSAEAAGPLALRADEPRLARAERVLLRTGRSIAAGTFPADWPVLEIGTAARLVAQGVRLIGVDCPSVDERHSTQLLVHRTIFGAGAWVLENLDLREVPAGRYELIALPVRTEGLDAAPVRALLVPQR